MQFLEESCKLVLISQGTNSDIYLYGDKQRGVILKMVSTSCIKEIKHLNNQYRMLNKLNQQNVIKVIRYKESINVSAGKQGKDQNKNVLVLEYAHHGSLLNLYKKIRPSLGEARWIFAQLCQAVRYLHCNYIVHRDLKADNVLVCQKEQQIQIKIGDFGFATDTRVCCTSSAYKGTKRGYMAPEIHKLRQNPQMEYNMYKTDIFALGVILFILVLGRLPFQFAVPENQHYKLIVEQNYGEFWKMHQQSLAKFEDSDDGSIEEFKKIFQEMVCFNAQNRPSMEQVIQCLWLKNKQEIIRNVQNDGRRILN